MAIKASFIPGAHQLSVFGDSGKNTVTRTIPRPQPNTNQSLEGSPDD